MWVFRGLLAAGIGGWMGLGCSDQSNPLTPKRDTDHYQCERSEPEKLITYHTVPMTLLTCITCTRSRVRGPSGGLLTLKGLASDDDVLLIRNKPAFWVRVLNPKSREKWKKGFFRLRFWAVLALFLEIFDPFLGIFD